AKAVTEMAEMVETIEVVEVVEMIEAGEARIKAAIEAEAMVEATHGHAPAAKHGTAKMAAAETTHVAGSNTAAMETAAAVAAAECQGRTARGLCRAKRDRGQQDTEAFHIIVLSQRDFG